MKYREICEYFGRKMPCPVEYKGGLEELQRFFDDMGVMYFTAREYATPHHRDIARQLGYADGLLIPPPHMWAHLAPCIAAADRLREVLGAPVACVNGWRPEDYNKRVDGSKRSDHITAHAVDVKPPPEMMALATVWAESILFEDGDRLLMSLGVGPTRLHIGFRAPVSEEKGYGRHWSY